MFFNQIIGYLNKNLDEVLLSQIIIWSKYYLFKVLISQSTVYLKCYLVELFFYSKHDLVEVLFIQSIFIKSFIQQKYYLVKL